MSESIACAVWEEVMTRGTFSPVLFCRALAILLTADTVQAAVSVAECIGYHISTGEPLEIYLPGVYALLQVCGDMLYLPTALDKLEALRWLADDRTIEVASVLLCIALAVEEDEDDMALVSLSAAHLLLETPCKRPSQFLPDFCRRVCESPLAKELTEDTLAVLRREGGGDKRKEGGGDKRKEERTKSFPLLSTPFPSHIGEYTGAGMSATITRTCLPSGMQVAIKQQTHADIFLKEIALMSTLNHPNVQDICGLDVHRMAFCMSFQSGGTLQDIINSNSLTYPAYRAYIADLFRGLAYIHSLGIMHGDLKPDNLLLSPSILKIADFGHAIGGMFSPKSLPIKYITPLHRPYELWIAGDDLDARVVYGTEVDVWSCGIIILEMTDNEGMRSRLRILGSVQAFIAELLEDRLETATRDMDRDIALVTRQCLSIPACRATAKQCLAGLI